MASESLAKKAMENVGEDNIRAQSAAEPPSGVTGQGNLNSPYDGGNAPDNIPRPGVEPPSGQEGKGTATDPYDAGNAPGNFPSGCDSVGSHQNCADTRLTPENASNVPAGQIEHSAPTGYPEHQGSGVPRAEPNVEEAQAITASKNELEGKNKETTEKFKNATGVAADGGNFDAAGPKSGREAKRS